MSLRLYSLPTFRGVFRSGVGKAVIKPHLTPVVPRVSATTVARRQRARPPASLSSQYGSVSCRIRQELSASYCAA